MAKIKFITNNRQFNEQIRKFEEQTAPLFERSIKDGISYCDQAAETATERFNRCVMYRTQCKYQDNNLQCRKGAI